MEETAKKFNLNHKVEKNFMIFLIFKIPLHVYIHLAYKSIELLVIFLYNLYVEY